MIVCGHGIGVGRHDGPTPPIGTNLAGRTQALEYDGRVRDPKPELREVSWRDDEDREALLALRFEVFVDEQGVPREMEVDDEDAPSRHFLAVVGGTPVGCVRLTPKGKVTRLCVVAARRGEGVGGALLARAVDEARAAGFERIYLHAQTHAGAFYERYGFEARGEPFMEAGIEHRKMVLVS